MKIEILNRWNGSVLFSHEAEENSIAITVTAANLRGANLRSANLRSANLRSADLRSADLRSADLGGADLCSADLRGANLRSANLRSANLRSADLRSANLRGADLCSADLCSADLRSADLRGADLSPIKNDMIAAMSVVPREVQGLINALKEGRIDGSCYQGVCSCFVGTIAVLRSANYQEIPGLAPDSSRPVERFFMGIAKGDTPETNQVSALAVEWAEEWLGNMRAAFDPTFEKTISAE